MQHLGQGTVAEQARGEGNLEAEPVLGLADIEDVSFVKVRNDINELVLTTELGEGLGATYLV